MDVRVFSNEGDELRSLMLELHNMLTVIEGKPETTGPEFILYFGLNSRISALMNAPGFDAEGRDGTGTTHLMAAAGLGLDGVVKDLLNKDVIPTALDNAGRDALKHASSAAPCEASSEGEMSPFSSRSRRYFYTMSILQIAMEHAGQVDTDKFTIFVRSRDASSLPAPMNSGKSDKQPVKPAIRPPIA
ncbi:MAG: hypothetical protein Q7T16_02610 [Candidatus Burarchaeum sp.]|nr:hypothetical protein [Candidatus Burarchaeum sp.]MDO8339525.1 hypothetical protein [Candidatus Burarchaeum sp.]